MSADRETGAALSVTLGTVRTGNSGVASLTGVPMPPAGEWRLRAAGPDDDGNPVGGVFTVHDPDNPPVQGIGLGEWRGSYSLSASPSNCTTTREESGASYTQVRCTSISINDSLQIDEDGLAEWSYLATGSSRAVTTYDVSGRTCQWQTTWEMTADPAGFLSASFVVRQSLPDENGIPQTEGNAEFDGANIRYTYHSISSCSTDAEDGRLPQESHMSGEFLRGRHAFPNLGRWMQASPGPLGDWYDPASPDGITNSLSGSTDITIGFDIWYVPFETGSSYWGPLTGYVPVMPRSPAVVTWNLRRP
ncbi:MAG: hypothetical protein V9G12_17550 [Microthrixaceae bacterium]